VHFNPSRHGLRAKREQVALNSRSVAMWTVVRDELRETVWLVAVIGSILSLSVGLAAALAVVV
jgi:hypothetical protein